MQNHSPMCDPSGITNPSNTPPDVGEGEGVRVRGRGGEGGGGCKGEG